MIRVSDAAILAYTKLRTRKVRTIITVIISGILFSGLVFAIVAFTGIERSINGFSEEGLGKRFIASVTDVNSYNSDIANQSGNKDVIARAKVIHTELIEAKKKEAKRLNIMYDPATETRPVDKNGDQEWLNVSTEAGRRALQEYARAHPQKDSFVKIKEYLAPYNPVAYYSGQAIHPRDGDFQTMKDGQEIFDKKENNEQMFSGGINPYEEADDPAVQGMQMLDGELTKPFILKNASWKPSEKTIPIIITYHSAEKFLGLKKLKNDATAKEKLARIAEIRDKASAITFDICYRNTTSKQQIATAIATQREIEKNKNNNAYQKPALMYGLPAAESCGAAVITRDTRSPQEKLYDAHQTEFDKKFNHYADPYQAKFKLRVVGLSPGSAMQSSGLMMDIVSSLLNSSLGGSWIIPRDMYDSLPSADNHANLLRPQSASPDEPDVDSYAPNEQRYAEFANAADARAAIKKYSCSMFGCSSNSIYLMQFGSGSITLAEAKETLIRGLTTVALVVAGIAALIMAGTIGRMIADGRRETAVFRAIGANRGSISLIYIVYTLLLSLLVAIFAVILGTILAMVLDSYVSTDATASAQLMFGSSDMSRQFHLYGFMSIELLFIVGLVFVTGLVSMLLPLARNVRRNPINDMRDE